jgi:nucleotide-binding universal stress UspA family protein
VNGPLDAGHSRIVDPHQNATPENPMTTTVLVPLDGSDKDERALPAAAALADLTDGALHLIRVLEPPDDTLVPRARALGIADVMHEEREGMERSVRGTAERLAAVTRHRVSAEVADGADVAATLLRRADERNADVVVMATRAAGALGRALRGSVADRVVRQSPRPVVLVPPGADDTSGKRIELRRVLIPLDGSALSLNAIDHLLALPHGDGLEYVLLEVIPPAATIIAATPDAPAWAATLATAEAYLGSTDIGQVRAAAEQRLNTVADRLRARGAKVVDVRVVEATDPAAAIAAAVRADLADFIAMSTHGSSGFKRMVLGSVAEKVVRESDVPVLLVTAGESMPKA